MSNELQKIRRIDLPPCIRRFYDWLSDSAKNVANGLGIKRHPTDEVYIFDYDLIVTIEYNGKMLKYPFMITIRVEMVHDGLCAITYSSRLCAFCVGDSEILKHEEDMGFVVTKLDSEGQLFKIFMVLEDKFLFRVSLSKMEGDYGPIDSIEAASVVLVNDMETFLSNLNLFETAVINITKLYPGIIDKIEIKPWATILKEKEEIKDNSQFDKF